MVKMWVLFCSVLFCISQISLRTKEKRSSPSFLDDKEEGVLLLLLLLQERHLHLVCVHHLNEPASVQSRLKRSLSADVSLHVEDEGEGALVALGDLPQPPLITPLQTHKSAIVGIVSIKYYSN